VTITLSPEQERLVDDLIAAGLAETPDEAIDKAVRALHDAAPITGSRLKASNLSELLLNSPFAGADLDLRRSSDFPRPVELE
jgi:Arc/MetJ-type ribon-helix-helix transcriptional regulator